MIECFGCNEEAIVTFRESGITSCMLEEERITFRTQVPCNTRTEFSVVLSKKAECTSILAALSTGRKLYPFGRALLDLNNFRSTLSLFDEVGNKISTYKSGEL